MTVNSCFKSINYTVDTFCCRIVRCGQITPLSTDSVSPFAHILRQLREQYGLRQTELAEVLSYEQSYISALELGSKGPPTWEFVERLIKALSLPSSEADLLRQAREASERKLEIPTNAAEETYLLCNTLRNRIGQLHPLQLKAILAILALADDLKPVSPMVMHNAQRRLPITRMKEGAM